MSRHIPPEQMTIRQIQTEIDQEFQQWNDIACNGCQDPGWPDGINMNLIRNHIVFWYSMLDEKCKADTQLSFLDDRNDAATRRPIPPEVPAQYMVAGCQYSDRLHGRCDQALVWGTKGEYQA